jgi:hypothetical protein
MELCPGRSAASGKTLDFRESSNRQAPTSYRKGMTVFVHAIGGAMLEASIGGQKFKFTAK